MKNQLSILLVGLVFLSGVCTTAPASADTQWEKASDKQREANRESRRAAHQRAEMRKDYRKGHGLGAKLHKMHANSLQKRSARHSREASRHRYKARHHL